MKALKALEIFSQTAGNVGKSRLAFFPLPIESAGKIRPSERMATLFQN